MGSKCREDDWHRVTGTFVGASGRSLSNKALHIMQYLLEGSCTHSTSNTTAPMHARDDLAVCVTAGKQRNAY